jgi:hypothetical protein
MPPEVNIADLIRMLGPTQPPLAGPQNYPAGYKAAERAKFGLQLDPTGAAGPPWPGYPAGYKAAERAKFGLQLDPTGAAGPLVVNTLLDELGGIQVEPEGPMPGPGRIPTDRRPTDDMLQLSPEELDDLTGDIEYEEDPLMAGADIPRARMVDIPGESPEPMRPYIRAPGAPGMPEDPGFTQADMEEIMEKHAIYGGPTPIAPRAARKPQLSPERQRELAQRKFLTRFMHPSVKFMFGNPKAWPYLSQMELGRMQADTQGEALKESRAERIARDAMTQRQLQWQRELSLKQLESTERERLEALGFSREEAAAKAKESAADRVLLESQFESRERGEERRYRETEAVREATAETERLRFESSEDRAKREYEETKRRDDQQHEENMTAFGAQTAGTAATAKLKESEQRRADRDQDHMVARGSAQDLRADAKLLRDEAATKFGPVKEDLIDRAEGLEERARNIMTEFYKRQTGPAAGAGDAPPAAGAGGELPPPAGGVVPGETPVDPVAAGRTSPVGTLWAVDELSPNEHLEKLDEHLKGQLVDMQGELTDPTWLNWLGEHVSGAAGVGEMMGAMSATNKNRSFLYMAEWLANLVSDGSINDRNVYHVGQYLKQRIHGPVMNVLRDPESMGTAAGNEVSRNVAAANWVKQIISGQSAPTRESAEPFVELIQGGF